MKIYTTILVAGILATGICSCSRSKDNSSSKDNDSINISEENDTAIYGTIGEGTTMHMLEIQTEDGKTLSFEMDTDSLSDIQGGVFSGDHVTLTTRASADSNEPQVAKLINMNTLMGRWTSLARNFEIKADGEVISTQKAESNPYTKWKMCNGKIILNTDTFSIALLGPDSLELENNNGIFTYKRAPKSKQ